MKKDNKCCEDRSGLLIGAGTMIGLGVGFFLLEKSALLFVGSIMIGIGAGLVAAYIVNQKKK